MTVVLVQAFLQSLLNLGGSLGSKLGENASVILAALNAGQALLKQGEVGVEDLKKLTAEVEAMVADGRNPSDEELAALKSRFDAAYDVAYQYLLNLEQPTGDGN